MIARTKYGTCNRQPLYLKEKRDNYGMCNSYTHLIYILPTSIPVHSDMANLIYIHWWSYKVLVYRCVIHFQLIPIPLHCVHVDVFKTLFLLLFYLVRKSWMLQTVYHYMHAPILHLLNCMRMFLHKLKKAQLVIPFCLRIHCDCDITPHAPL